MDQTLPPLMQALLVPWRFPGATSSVELVQTPISWVLLAGDLAYKIKKPLKLPFLDFSTLEKRHACCQEELRLNQRYAPDLYLAVIPICNTPEDPQLEGTGEPIEYAVKMRRFDEAARLDRVCDRGELLPAHWTGLARTLVAFHGAAAVAPPDSLWGLPGEVVEPMHDNFFDLCALLPQADVNARLMALQRWTEAQFAQLRPLMMARKHWGFVRECHGDLHLANMVLIDQQVRLFDCIEFSEDLRWIDVACEIAFTWMDLLAHGHPGLGNWFVNEVLSFSGDDEAALLLRFYAVYRALVRAKVAALPTGAGPGEALRYLALAEQLTAPPPARLVITHGLSGSGKTMQSSLLLQSDAQACTLRVRADVARKHLFGLESTACSHSPVGGGLYAAEAHDLTYARLHTLADSLLRAGWSVVVDATFLKRADRATFAKLAVDLGVPFSILAPSATPEQLRERIVARQAAGADASEATLQVLALQMKELEPLLPDELAACQSTRLGSMTHGAPATLARR